jgi:hypothetical protein
MYTDDGKRQSPRKGHANLSSEGLTTLSTTSSTEIDSQESAPWALQRRKAIKDHFMKEKQQAHEQYTLTAPRSQLKEKSRSLDARPVSVSFREDTFSPEIELEITNKALLEQSRLNISKKDRVRTKGAMNKVASTFTACTTKARDTEYESYLAATYINKLDFEGVPGFSVIHPNESKPKSLKDLSETPVESSTVSSIAIKRKPSITEPVTLHVPEHINPMPSQLTTPRKPSVVVPPRDKILRNQDIESINATLDQIERNLRDAASRGEKVSRAEMVKSLSTVAISLDVPVDQLMGGKLKPTTKTLKRIESAHLEEKKEEHVCNENVSTELDSEDDDANTGEPSWSSLLSEITLTKQGGSQIASNQDKNSPAKKDDGSEDSEFSKWINEIEDDESRETNSFLQEIFSSISVISRPVNLPPRVRTAEAVLASVASNVSKGSSSTRTTHRQRSGLTENATISKGSDGVDETPLPIKYPKPRSMSPIARVRLRSYGSTSNSCRRTDRRRSSSFRHSAISENTTSRGSTKYAPSRNSRTNKSDDVSSSDTSQDETYYDDSTFRSDSDGLVAAFGPLFRIPLKGLEAACGHLNDLVIGHEVVVQDAHLRSAR